MEKSWKTSWLWPTAWALLGIGTAAAFSTWDPWSKGADLALWLRKLSLSGTGGNAAAWGLVLSVSALPALGLLWKERKRADLLLALAALELFMGLYFLVNPTLFFPAALGNVREIVASWGLVAGGSVLGTLSTWVLLRLLSGLENAPAKLLPGFLLCAAALYGFLAAASTVLDTISAVENVAAGNTDAARVLKSDVLLWTLAVLKLIPSLLGAWVLLWGSELSRMLDSSPFAEETVLLAETVAHRCGIVARASLIVAVGCNLLQLLCSPVVSVIHVSVYLPFGTLALCAILLLLCRYFRRAKAVNDDNNSII